MSIQALIFSKVETSPKTSSMKRNERKRKEECPVSENREFFSLVNSVWERHELISLLKPITGADDIDYPPGTRFEIVEVSVDVVPLFDYRSATAKRKQRLCVPVQNLDTLKLLLPDNTNIELSTFFRTPDEDLVFHGRNLSVIEKLLQSGAIISYRHGAGISTLAHCAALRKSTTLIPVLQRCGVDLNGVSSDGRTPLHIAIQIKSLEMVVILLNNGANPNALMADGSSPLHLAIRCKFIGAVVLLVENGADVNATNNENQSPLALASEVNDAASIEILLKNGVDLISAATHPELLIRAVQHNEFELAQKLLEHGARVNQKHMVAHLFHPPRVFHSSLKLNKHETTAIHVACAFADEKMVQLLLDHGADPNVECEGSEEEIRMPISIAVAANAEGIVKLLLKNGVTVCSHGGDLLILAIEEKNSSLMKLFLENGCDFNVADLTKSNKISDFVLDLKNGDSLGMLMLYGSSFNLLEVDFKLFDGDDHEDTFNSFVSHVFKDLEETIEVKVRGILSCIDFDDVNYDEYEVDYSPSSDLGVCAEILAKHMIKLIVAGKQVDESVIPAEFNEYFHLDVLRAECEDEIELMKSNMVCETSISFYDVLTKNSNTVSWHLKNDIIRQTLINYQFEEEFPQYGSIIQCLVRRADVRLEFSRKGMKSFNLLVCRLPRLPSELKEEILGLLSIRDLIQLNLCFPSK